MAMGEILLQNDLATSIVLRWRREVKWDLLLDANNVSCMQRHEQITAIFSEMAKKHLHPQLSCAIIFVAPEKVKCIRGISTVGRTNQPYFNPNANPQGW
jgi:hypothetical protein